MTKQVFSPGSMMANNSVRSQRQAAEAAARHRRLLLGGVVVCILIAYYFLAPVPTRLPSRSDNNQELTSLRDAELARTKGPFKELKQLKPNVHQEQPLNLEDEETLAGKDAALEKEEDAENEELVDADDEHKLVEQKHQELDVAEQQRREAEADDLQDDGDEDVDGEEANDVDDDARGDDNADADDAAGDDVEQDDAVLIEPKLLTSRLVAQPDDTVRDLLVGGLPEPRKAPLSLRPKLPRVLVTGGAGFVGSHLVDRLMERGHEVIVVDNYFTGRKENVLHHIDNPRFELLRHDVVEPLLAEVDQIYHLACPASPVHYKYNPVKTIKTSVMGTINMLGLAKRVGARFLLASTSEIYGDPLQHPQQEEYWGNVNPIGVRSCYDEGKRVAETLSFDYHRGLGIEIRVARIFNTYGPRMSLDDGRVVSNFVAQALRKEPMTIYGDGMQTRSFQYVSDLVAGLMALMDNNQHTGPFNIGNPGEFTMNELAEVVKEVIDRNAKVTYVPNTEDDPHKRKPDITKAKELLGWEPKVALKDGLPLMVEDFRKRVLGTNNTAKT
eukprot:jgi/Chlat1/2704/Chrsp180S08753